MANIDFYSKTNFCFVKQKDLGFWVKKVICKEGAVLKKISFTALNQADLFKLNKKYLCRVDYTDVLAFDYSFNSKIKGEVFFSVDAVKKNASLFNVFVRDEFLRVMVHGLLHLLGYKDNSVAKKLVMRKKEDKYISLYLDLFHVKPFDYV